MGDRGSVMNVETVVNRHAAAWTRFAAPVRGETGPAG
jgi:hypothetical protein